ncbi:hypothetical protein HYH02_008083 [Chlamydomonas schloesseri]|uniref:Uncharacterized protein n=1 Tax=Chlamydomonas schloesseri TaxID=2026947 RepID=A0A835WGJ7_9CHLO|nr:hypothetical protein HYH02_008083 [Chlamydomonas schloesseri]|eukprot:KAG2446928.1 hypothetical protein HYH02_008083 [Chlamydomonas schloesseri]
MDRPLSIPLLLLAARAAGWAAMKAVKRVETRSVCSSAVTTTSRLPQRGGRRLPRLPARHTAFAVPASRTGTGLRPAPTSASALRGGGPAGAAFGAFGASSSNGSCGSGAAGGRSYSTWASSVKSRIFPAAVRLALPMAAACMAAAAAGTHGQYYRAGVAPGTASPTAVTAAAAATHGAAAAAAMAAPPPPPVPADVRACRQLLEARGLSHPGLQPGASWAALPAGRPSSKGSGDLHVMFEYLLLFPA